MSFPIMPILKRKSGVVTPPLGDIWLWLDFDGDFTDDSGNSYTFVQADSGSGCDTNFGITDDRTLGVDKALRVANVCGTNDMTYLTRNLLSTKTFDSGLTFSAWIKKINNRPNTDYAFTSDYTISTDLGLAVYVKNNPVGNLSSIRAGGTVTNYASLDNNYHHHFITITSGKLLTFWLDKVKIMDAVNITNHVTAKAFRIGTRIATPFNGVIDHILMYDAPHSEYMNDLYDFV